MSNDTVGLIWILAPLLGLIPATIARRKGNSFVILWIAGTLMFIVALPVAILMKPNPKKFEQCPACRGWIPADALKCMHCAEPLNP